MEYAYEVLYETFKILHASEETESPCQKPLPLMLPKKTVQKLQVDVLEVITRLKTMEQVLKDETPPELAEVYDRMLERHLASMENVNMDPDPFFEVKQIFSLGHEVYKSLTKETELWYGVGGPELDADEIADHVENGRVEVTSV